MAFSNILFRRLSPFLLAIALFFSSTSSVNAENQRFNDVSIHQSDYAAVEFLAEKNIFRGYDDGRFDLNRVMNRAELMAITARMLDIEPDVNDYQNCFLDVQTQWFAPYICYAKAQNWIEGYGDGNFKPDQKVSSSEAMKIILNPYFSSEIQQQSLSDQLYALERKSLDANQHVVAWFTPYLALAAQKNIEDKIAPSVRNASLEERNVSRGAVADMMYKMLLSREQNWDVYEDYERDSLYLDRGQQNFLSENYPCYRLSNGAPDFLIDYIRNEKGYQNIDRLTRLRPEFWNDLTNLPIYNVEGYCRTATGGHVMSGLTIEQDGSSSQQLVKFDANNTVTNVDSASCNTWTLQLVGELSVDLSPQMDFDSLELDGCFFAKDQSRVYVLEDNEIPSANVDTFVGLDLPYAKDAQDAYFLSQVISGADAASFESLVSTSGPVELGAYAKDQNQVYFFGESMANADPSSFEVLNSPTPPEAWLNTHSVTDIDADLFELIFAKDRNHVYASGLPINNVDPASFELVSDTRGMDKNGNYLLEPTYGDNDTWFLPPA